MIRSAYIHEFDMFDEMTNLINENASELEHAFRDYEYNCDKIRLMALNESVEDPYFTEGAKELVEKVGRGVKAIIDKLITLIEKVSDTFNQYLWNRKSDIQKAEQILTKFPKQAERIQLAIEKGDIDVKDIKSLQEVMNGSYDILSKLKDDKIEPSEAEKKFNAVIEKYNKFGKPIIEIVGGVGTVVGAVAAIHKLYPELMKNRIDAGKYKRKLREIEVQARIDANDEGRQSNVAAVKNRIVSGMASVINRHLTASNSLFSRFGHMIYNILRRADTTPGDERAHNLRDRQVRARRNTDTYLSIADRVSMDVERDKEYAKAVGRRDADRDAT